MVKLDNLATNQGVVGSNPAGRANFQRLRTAKPDPRLAYTTFARPFIHSRGSRIACFRRRISRLQGAGSLSCQRDRARDWRGRRAVQCLRSRSAPASFEANDRVARRDLLPSHRRREGASRRCVVNRALEHRAAWPRVAPAATPCCSYRSLACRSREHPDRVLASLRFDN